MASASGNSNEDSIPIPSFYEWVQRLDEKEMIADRQILDDIETGMMQWDSSFLWSKEDANDFFRDYVNERYLKRVATWAHDLSVRQKGKDSTRPAGAGGASSASRDDIQDVNARLGRLNMSPSSDSKGDEGSYNPSLQRFLDSFDKIKRTTKDGKECERMAPFEAGQTVTFSETLFGLPLAIDTIYIREAYIAAAKKILGSYNSAEEQNTGCRKRERAKVGLELLGCSEEDIRNLTWTTTASHVFTGSPGTGKSTCIAFLALVCYLPGIPFKVIGHQKGLVFTGYANSPGMDHDCLEREIIHMIDHYTDFLHQPTHRVVFTSPSFERSKRLGKHPSQISLNMDVWRLEELLDCNSKCYKRKPEQIRKLFAKFGGIIRFVMKKPELGMTFDEWLRKLVYQEIDKRILRIHSREDLHSTLVTEDKSGDKSFVLVHIHTLSKEGIAHDADSEEVCGSNYIRDLLAKTIKKEMDDASVTLFFQLSGGGPKATALKGQLFQPIVGRALQVTWDERAEKNRIRYLGPISPAPFKVLQCQRTAMKLALCDSPDEVWKMLSLDHSIDRLLVLGNESFPVGDFIRKSPKGVGADYDIFQSTVSNDHNLTQEGLQMLKAYLPGRDDGVDLTLRIFSAFHLRDSSSRHQNLLWSLFTYKSNAFAEVK